MRNSRKSGYANVIARKLSSMAGKPISVFNEQGKKKEGVSNALSTTSFDTNVSSRGALERPSVLNLLRKVATVNIIKDVTKVNSALFGENQMANASITSSENNISKNSDGVNEKIRILCHEKIQILCQNFRYFADDYYKDFNCLYKKSSLKTEVPKVITPGVVNSLNSYVENIVQFKDKINDYIESKNGLYQNYNTSPKLYEGALTDSVEYANVK